MAQIEKEAFYQGLQDYQVYITDTDSNSKYFAVKNIPTALTAGKNYFLIKGTSLLKPWSPVKVEVLDIDGNVIYSEIPNVLVDGSYRMVIITVYPTAKNGPATITILGEAQDVPSNWVGKYNVKWQKMIQIDTMQGDTGHAIFKETPRIQITEIYDDSSTYDYIYTPTTVTTGYVRGTSYDNKSRDATYYLLASDGLEFTSNMVGGIITVASPNTGESSPKQFVTQITNIINNSTAVVVPSYISATAYTSSTQRDSTSTAFQPKEFSYSSYELVYDLKTQNVGSSNKRISYLDVYATHIDTYVGSIKFVEFYKLPGNIFIGKYPVQPHEMIISGSLLETLVDFTDSWKFIDTHNSASLSNSTLINSVHINFGDISEINACKIVNTSSLYFNAGVEYQLSAKVVNKYLESMDALEQPRIRFNVTSSIFGPCTASDGNLASFSTDYFDGQEKVTNTTALAEDIKRNTPTYVSKNFIADVNCTGSLILDIWGDWYISDISIKPFQDGNFNAGEFKIRIPNPAYRLEEMSLGVQFIGGDGNVVGNYYNTTPLPAFYSGEYIPSNPLKSRPNQSYYYIVTGSNTVISHNDNIIDGDLYVARNLRTGIHISGQDNAMIRSVGYEGWISASKGISPAGFVIFSGSILPNYGSTDPDDKRGTYDGIGLELNAGDGTVDPMEFGALRFRADTTGSFIEILTPNFFFGDKNPGGSFISGSGGILEIKSGNMFWLKPDGTLIIASGSSSMDATTGFVAGWIISATDLQAANNTIKMSSPGYGYISMGKTLPTSVDDGEGIFLSGSGDALIGDADGYRIHFSGSILTLSASAFFLGNQYSYVSGSGDRIEISSSKFFLRDDGVIVGYEGTTTEGFKYDGTNFILSSSKFLLGDTSKQYISGAGGILKISSSNFYLDPTILSISASSFFVGNPITSYISGAGSRIAISASNFYLNPAGNLIVSGNLTASNLLAGSPNGYRLQYDGTNIFVSASNFFVGSYNGAYISGSGTGLKISSSNFYLDSSSVIVSASTFFVGNPNTAYISGAGSQIAISSSGFYLQPNGTAVFSGSITASAGELGGWKIGPTFLSSSNLILDSTGNIRTGDFMSGYRGWKINSAGKAEFENAIIRGTLATTVFEKDVVAAVGGQVIIANSTALSGSHDDLTTTFYVDNSYGFVHDEICVLKATGSTGFSTEYVKLDGIYSGSAQHSMSVYFRGFDGYGTSASYSPGQVIVSLGAVDSGYVYINAAPSKSLFAEYGPFIDVVVRTGSTNYDEIEVKARLGKLSGINSPTMGYIDGYGLYTQNAYLEGNAQIVGTLAAGGGNVVGNTFYVGRINKNFAPTSNTMTQWSAGGNCTISEVSDLGPFGVSQSVAEVIVNNPSNIFGTRISPYNFDFIPPIELYQWWTISFWAKGISGTPKIGIGSEKGAAAYDRPADHVGLFAENNQTAMQTIPNDNIWNRYVMSFRFTNTYTPDGSKFSFFIYCDSVGTIRVAGIQVEKNSDPNEPYVSVYQPNNSAVYTGSDGYGMWAIAGGFGGSIQNPVTAITGSGIFVRNVSSPSEVYQDGIFIGDWRSAAGFDGVILSSSGMYGYDNNTEIFSLDGNGLFVRASNFYVGDADRAYISGSGSRIAISSSKFYLNGDGNVTLAGTITATDGAIGGWEIDATDIHAASNTAKLSSAGNGYVSLGATPPTAYNAGAGIFFGGDGTALIGNSAGMRIQFDGSNLTIYSTYFDLNPSGVSLTGTVTAGSGYIGGWALDAGTIYNINGAKYSGLSSTDDSDIRFFAGASTLDGSGSAPFIVKSTGEISATAGTIGGYTISSDAISIFSGGDGAFITASIPFNGAGTGFVIQNYNDLSGETKWSGLVNGTTAEFSGQSIVFFIGSDGTNAVSSPFYVLENGYVSASAGKIGSTFINTDNLTGGKIQTSLSGQRVVMDDTSGGQFRVYNSGGDEIVMIGENIYPPLSTLDGIRTGNGAIVLISGSTGLAPLVVMNDGMNSTGIVVNATGAGGGTNRAIVAHAINGATNWAGYFGSSTNNSGHVYITDTLYLGDNSDSVDTNIYRSAANELKTDDSLIVGVNLGVTGSMFVNGDVGIGTGAPGTDLEVYGTNAECMVHFGGNSRGGLRAMASQQVGFMSTAEADDLVFGWEDGHKGTFTKIATIDNGDAFFSVTGEIRATGDIIAYYSDERLKDNVYPLTNALHRLLSIRGVEFDWNNKATPKRIGTHDVGLIAQEVQKVLPEAVTKEWGEGKEKYYSVLYDKLVPLLIESIREQQSQIDSLKQEVNILKEKLNG